MLLFVVLGSFTTIRVAAPVVVVASREVTTPGVEPATLVSSAVTLAAAAALTVVACWVATATTWCVLAALLTGGGRGVPPSPRFLSPRLVRFLVGAALGTTALAALPAAAATSDTAGPGVPALPRALAGLPLPDRPAETAPAPPAPPPDPPSVPSPAAAVGAPRAHTVVAGDSLWSIAAHHLAPDAPPAAVDRRWRAVYDANRSRIGDDPDLIRPGTVLRLPRPLA